MIRVLIVARLFVLITIGACFSAHATNAPLDWPWSPDLAAATDNGDDPASLLRQGLRPYAKDMDSLRQANWLEQRGDDLRPKRWNEALLTFRSRCPVSDSVCVALVHGELMALQEALVEAKHDAHLQSLAPSITSAIADLCSDGYGVDQNFGICGLAKRLHKAGFAWLSQGHETLALDYLGRYDDERQQFLDWLVRKGDKITESIQLALPEIPALVRRQQWELLGRLDAARMAWFEVYGQTSDLTEATSQGIFSLVRLEMEMASEGHQFTEPPHVLPELPGWIKSQLLELPGTLNVARMAWFGVYGQNVDAQNAAHQGAQILSWLAATETSRLSWRLGETDLAQAFEDISHVNQPTIESCLVQQARVRLAIARADAENHWPAEADLWVRHLQQSQCNYTLVTQELVTDALLRGESYSPKSGTEIQRVLDLAIKTCNHTKKCMPYRLAQLQKLQAMTWGPMRNVPALLQQRLAIYDQIFFPPASEQRLDWALGRALLERPNTSTELRSQALKLLQAVQIRVIATTKVAIEASQDIQRNFSRFDPLHRIIARTQVQQGQLLPLENSEILRAQTLLRRLRLQRMKQVLVGEHDALADALFQQKKDYIDRLRAQGQELARKNLVVGQWLVRRADDILAMAEIQRLETLAARKLERDGRRASDWLTRGRRDALNDLLDPLLERWIRSAGDRLAPQEVYISWLQVPGGYIASVMTLQDERPHLSNHWVPFNETDQENLKLWRELLRTGSASPVLVGGPALRGRPLWRLPNGRFIAAGEAPKGARRVQQPHELGQALGERLFSPLPSAALNRTKLIISPDGSLALLPFETLWWHDQPIINGRDLTYVQSLAIWEELQRQVATRLVGPTRLLSIASPRYDLPPLDGAMQMVNHNEANSSEPEWMVQLDWRPLPGTKTESDSLVTLYQHSEQWLGEEASRARLDEWQSSGRLADIQLLHFATHAYVDDERSALVLSMQQSREAAYLQDSQIAQLSLRSLLVVLSACETGLGRQQSGEGVMGLPYAFMLAGNVDTLMSLWSVDDQGTATFIPIFMGKVSQGMDVVSALNATKREFQVGQHGDALRDPRIWAAFLLYGVPLTLPVH